MGATYMIDLDGTVLRHGSNDVLPGAQDLLDGIIQMGGQIIFTTRRGDKEFKGHKFYSADAALKAVKSLNVPYVALVTDVDSPRIVINDTGSFAHNHDTNAEWTIEEIELATFLPKSY